MVKDRSLLLPRTPAGCHWLVIQSDMSAEWRLQLSQQGWLLPVVLCHGS